MRTILKIVAVLIFIGSFINLANEHTPIIPGFIIPLLIAGLLFHLGSKKSKK